MIELSKVQLLFEDQELLWSGFPKSDCFDEDAFCLKDEFKLRSEDWLKYQFIVN